MANIPDNWEDVLNGLLGNADQEKLERRRRAEEAMAARAKKKKTKKKTAKKRNVNDEVTMEVDSTGKLAANVLQADEKHALEKQIDELLSLAEQLKIDPNFEPLKGSGSQRRMIAADPTLTVSDQIDQLLKLAEDSALTQRLFEASARQDRIRQEKAEKHAEVVGEADDDFINQILEDGGSSISDDDLPVRESSPPPEAPTEIDMSGDADDDFIQQMLAGGASAEEGTSDPAPTAAEESPTEIDMSGDADDDFIQQMLAGGESVILDDDQQASAEDLGVSDNEMVHVTEAGLSENVDLSGDADDDFIQSMLNAPGDQSEIASSDDQVTTSSEKSSLDIQSLEGKLNSLVDQVRQSRLDLGDESLLEAGDDVRGDGPGDEDSSFDWGSLEDELNQLVDVVKTQHGDQTNGAAVEPEVPEAGSNGEVDLSSLGDLSFDLNSELNSLLGEVKEIQSKPDPGLSIDDLSGKLDKMIIRVKTMEERKRKKREEDVPEKSGTEDKNTESENNKSEAYDPDALNADLNALLGGGQPKDTESKEPKAEEESYDSSSLGDDLNALLSGASQESASTEKAEHTDIDMSGDADDDFIQQMLSMGGGDDTEESPDSQTPAEEVAETQADTDIDMSGDADDDFIQQMLAMGGGDDAEESPDSQAPAEEVAETQADADIDMSGDADDDFIQQMLSMGGGDDTEESPDSQTPAEEVAETQADTDIDMSGDADDDFIQQMLSMGDGEDEQEASESTAEVTAEDQTSETSEASYDLSALGGDLNALLGQTDASDNAPEIIEDKETSEPAEAEASYDLSSLGGDLNALLGEAKTEQLPESKNEAVPAEETKPEKPEASAPEPEVSTASLENDLNALLESGQAAEPAETSSPVQEQATGEEEFETQSEAWVEEDAPKEEEAQEEEIPITAQEAEHVVKYNIDALVEMTETKKSGKSVKRPPPPPVLEDAAPQYALEGYEAVVNAAPTAANSETDTNKETPAASTPAQVLPKRAKIGGELSGQALEDALNKAFIQAKDIRDGKVALEDVHGSDAKPALTVAPVGQILSLEDLESSLDEAVDMARQSRDGTATLPTAEELWDKQGGAPPTPASAAPMAKTEDSVAFEGMIPAEGKVMSLDQVISGADEDESTGQFASPESLGKQKQQPQPVDEPGASATAESGSGSGGGSRLDQLLASGAEISPDELDRLLAEDASGVQMEPEYSASVDPPKDKSEPKSGGVVSLDELEAMEASKRVDAELDQAERQLQQTGASSDSSDFKSPQELVTAESDSGDGTIEKPGRILVKPDPTAYAAWIKSVSEEGLELTLKSMEAMNSYLDKTSPRTKVSVGLIGGANLIMGAGLLIAALFF